MERRREGEKKRVRERERERDKETNEKVKSRYQTVQDLSYVFFFAIAISRPRRLINLVDKNLVLVLNSPSFSPSFQLKIISIEVKSHCFCYSFDFARGSH